MASLGDGRRAAPPVGATNRDYRAGLRISSRREKSLEATFLVRVPFPVCPSVHAVRAKC